MGMSGRFNVPEMPFPFADGESLVQAICCDSAFSVYAEPQHYYAKPDVNFFGALKNKKQPIAFYDSVCGIPLFHIPKHRTLKDFEAETTEHGWPSFRPDEAVKGNIVIRGMEVLSSCGTHLGSNRKSWSLEGQTSITLRTRKSTYMYVCMYVSNVCTVCKEG